MLSCDGRPQSHTDSAHVKRWLSERLAGKPRHVSHLGAGKLKSAPSLGFWSCM